MLLLSKLLAVAALTVGATDGKPASLAPLSALETEQFSPCSPARDGEYLDVCSRFTSEPGTIRCIAAGRDRFFSTCAIGVCLQFTTEEGSIQCLEAARDKAYTEQEAMLCGRFSTEDGAVGCLAASGTRRYPRDDDDQDTRYFLRRIRADLLDAAYDLRDGRIGRAQAVISGVIDQIDRYDDLSVRPRN